MIDAAIKIGVIGILILLSPILLPIFIVWRIYDSITLRVFRLKHAGYFFLICTSRHDWYDFLSNNVIPILPDNVRVAWYHTKNQDKRPELFQRLSQSKIYGLSKPYLVAVTKKAIHAKSLHTEFQVFKPCSKRSEEVQSACRKIIEVNQNELLTCGSIRTA